MPDNLARVARRNRRRMILTVTSNVNDVVLQTVTAAIGASRDLSRQLCSRRKIASLTCRHELFITKDLFYERQKDIHWHIWKYSCT